MEAIVHNSELLPLVLTQITLGELMRAVRAVSKCWMRAVDHDLVGPQKWRGAILSRWPALLALFELGGGHGGAGYCALYKRVANGMIAYGVEYTPMCHAQPVMTSELAFACSPTGLMVGYSRGLQLLVRVEHAPDVRHGHVEARPAALLPVAFIPRIEPELLVTDLRKVFVADFDPTMSEAHHGWACLLPQPCCEQLLRAADVDEGLWSGATAGEQRDGKGGGEDKWKPHIVAGLLRQPLYATLTLMRKLDGRTCVLMYRQRCQAQALEGKLTFKTRPSQQSVTSVTRFLSEVQLELEPRKLRSDGITPSWAARIKLKLHWPEQELSTPEERSCALSALHWW